MPLSWKHRQQFNLINLRLHFQFGDGSLADHPPVVSQDWMTGRAETKADEEETAVLYLQLK